MYVNQSLFPKFFSSCIGLEYLRRKYAIFSYIRHHIWYFFCKFADRRGFCCAHESNLQRAIERKPFIPKHPLNNENNWTFPPQNYPQSLHFIIGLCARLPSPCPREGLGVGLHLIDNQRYYSLLQYPTPAPSPQMGELHGAAFLTNLFISKDMECLSYIYDLSKLP